MKPTDKKKPAAPQPKPKAKAGERASGAAPGRFSAIVLNAIGAIVSVVFLMAFFQHHEPDPANPGETHINSGYDWLLNTMLMNNLKQIGENPDKSVSDRYLMKWGPGEMVYVNQIKAVVPENGVVMLPPHDFFKQVGYVPTQTGPVLQKADAPNVSKFSMVDLPWISYFLYPRQVVYGDSVNKPLYAKANYIVSFNGWGLDKLNYQVEKPEQFMVLPIKK